MRYFLAIDMGASSGRHILGHVENGKIILEEVHRFKNRPEECGGKLVWNEKKLFAEIISGLKKCKQIGKIPVSMAIDTWGVDYVLFDNDGNEIPPAYSYRDGRTSKFFNNPPLRHSEFYYSTGSQNQTFNTVYQLLADKEEGRLDNAKDFLFLPQYFSYLLTGKKAHEYTEASTSMLVNAKTRQWDLELIEKVGLNKNLFSALNEPGHCLGGFKDEIKKETGFDCTVILPASHDTASAVVAVPKSDTIYISSGTWSLLGIEGDPILTKEALEGNYTNEGSIEGRIRFLKNIMGLWLIQELRREISDKYTFIELAQMAEEENNYEYSLDVDDQKFYAPNSMMNAIDEQCKIQNQPVPKTTGEYANAIYSSLAHSYKKAADGIEKVTKRKFDTICIVGGGCNNDYLNRLTARITGRKVLAGPSEATAIGNIIVQMVEANEIESYKKAKEMIINSFEIKEI